MLARIDNTLATIEGLIAAASLLTMLLLSLLQILSRNFFDTGFPHFELLNRHLLIIAGLMGAAIACHQSRHIKIDALSTVISNSWQRRLRLPLLLFAAVVALALTYYSVIFVQDEWQYAPANERWTLPFVLAYPVSFGAMALHFVLASLRTDSGTQPPGTVP